MPNKLSTHITSIKLDTIAKAIPKGLSVRVSYDNVDIFLKRNVQDLGVSIMQLSRDKEGWTHSKIFQDEKKDKTWISAKILKFADAEKLLQHMELSDKCESSVAIDRYKDNGEEIQEAIEDKAYPERGDIATMLQAGADLDDVIRLTEKVFNNEKQGTSDENMVKTVTPKEIKDILDKEVIGNEHAKKTIATAVSKHISTAGKCPKTNVLIVGESGTGKTELIRALKKHTGWNYSRIPVISYDASQLTPAGWRGINISDIIRQIINENPELSKVEQAIVQLDEMDKISDGEELGGGLLKQILKLIEGGKINAGDESNDSFTVRINGDEKTVTHVDTSRMLFIVSGVYAQFNAPKEKVIGFNKATTDKPAARININHDKIIESGVVPVELMGRIQAVTTTERMSKKQWRQCVEGKIKRDYQKIPTVYDMDIDDIINDDVMAEIVEETYGSKQGLRASINMMDDIINDAIYRKTANLSSHKKPKKTN